MAATTPPSSSSPSPSPSPSPPPEFTANPPPPPIHEPIAAAAGRNRAPSSPSSSAGSRSEPSAAAGSTSLHRPHQSIGGSQRSGGFLAFVDRTIGEIRPRQSLSRISIGPDQFGHVQPSPERALRSARPASNYAAPVGLTPVDGKQPSPTLVLGNPPSKPYTETDPSLPEPTLVSRLVDNKMHQTSSRLLRMTDDDRPFTKVSGVVDRGRGRLFADRTSLARSLDVIRR